MEEQQRKRRDRWKRNKAAERERNRKPMPDKLPADKVEQIWRERDRRLTMFPGWLARVEGWRGGCGSEAFQCDVWAIQKILQYQSNGGRVTPGKIARWMAENNLTHGYSHNPKSSSLRIMVMRSLHIIHILESSSERKRQNRSQAWPKFEIN